MTRSKVSPDGRIPDRDVAAKLVIIMVGLPARGKSYITKKIQRYLSWQQHNTRIFNVGNRRRIAAGVLLPSSHIDHSPLANGHFDAPLQEVASILLNGGRTVRIEEPPRLDLNISNGTEGDESDEKMDQSAYFFDPKNETASRLREQVALDTLDELIDYLINGNGSVGILDATNSTLHRRQLLVDRIKEREPRLGILFIESICNDSSVSCPRTIIMQCVANTLAMQLLEANMRLKLSGPDYINKDPVKSLKDFKARVAAYQSAYEPIGDYEEKNDLQYIQVINNSYL